MSDIVSLIETMPPAERAGALKVLDLMSRPMRARE